MLADRLEHVLHGDRLALEGAGQDRPAIDEDRRHVEAAHRHHHAGQRLVAARDADEAVIAVAPHGELDRIGDHFPRRQRRAHAIVPHRDTVGHRDGAEFARRAAGGRDAFLDRLRLAHQRDIARCRLVPAAGDADEGLMDLLGRQPHRVIVGPVRRARGAFGHVPARQPALKVGLGIHETLHRPRPKARSLSATDLRAGKTRTWKSCRAVAEKGRFRAMSPKFTNVVNVLHKRNICCQLAKPLAKPLTGRRLTRFFGRSVHEVAPDLIGATLLVGPIGKRSAAPSSRSRPITTPSRRRTAMAARPPATP